MDHRIGPKVTEIGMIFNLHAVRTEPGLGFVEFQDLVYQGDEVLVFAAPVDQGALGDTELPGDFGEADSPGTQFDVLLNGLLIFHYCLSSGRHW